MTLDKYEELCNMNDAAFIKWQCDKANDKEYRQWIEMHSGLTEVAKKTLDISEYMEMTADEVNKAIGALCKKGSKGVLPNGRMSPFGIAITDALFELADEKRTYESTLRMIDSTEHYRGRRDIVGLEVTPTEMAECGCCIERGGHTIVSFKDKLVLEFGNGGELIEKHQPGGAFKWLKFLT